MHYYVDGYNLLFRLLGGVSKNLKEERKQLITNLESKAHFLSLNISLIFDAQHQPGDDSRLHFHALEIIYTSKGKTADEFILEIITRKKNLRQITVVTSDKILAWHARRAGVHTESVEEFFSSINSRYKKKKSTKIKSPLPTKLKIERNSLSQEICKEILPNKTKQIAVEGSLDYYLEIFEKGFKDFQIEKMEQKKSKKISSRKIPKESIAQDKFAGLNEQDRWLKIFESRSNGEWDNFTSYD